MMSSPFLFIRFGKVLLVFSILFLNGCASVVRTWQYSPGEYGGDVVNRQENAKKHGVAVAVFEERLADGGVSVNRALLAAIPLVPFAKAHQSGTGIVKSMQHQKPVGKCIRQTDTGELMLFNPVISLSYALFSELRESGAFGAVEYVCSREDASSGVDYLVKGFVTDLGVDSTLYSYGLGFINLFLPLPFLLGAPVSSSVSTLGIELHFINIKTGALLFKKRYFRSSSRIFSSIFSVQSSFVAPELSFDIYGESVKDILGFVSGSQGNMKGVSLKESSAVVKIGKRVIKAR